MRMLLDISGSAPAKVAEAALELTFFSIDGHFSLASLAKSKPSISAWVDPAHKASTRPHNCILYLPLSLCSLQNPSSTLTVQILSPRLPFKPSGSSASASVPLSSLPLSGDPLTLHLRRPSGRVTSSVRFSVRILWSLGPDPVVDDSSSFGAEAVVRLEPSAPPLPEPEFQPDERMREENMAWRSFLVGALSGAVAAIRILTATPHVAQMGQ